MAVAGDRARALSGQDKAALRDRTNTGDSGGVLDGNNQVSPESAVLDDPVARNPAPAGCTVGGPDAAGRQGATPNAVALARWRPAVWAADRPAPYFTPLHPPAQLLQSDAARFRHLLRDAVGSRDVNINSGLRTSASCKIEEHFGMGVHPLLRGHFACPH